MKISVIIPAYENLNEVLTCLNSLRATSQEFDVEYIVSDDSVKIDMSSLIPPEVARVVKTSGKFGFAGNCNFGATHATGDILFFVNQDIVVPPGEHACWQSGIAEALHFKQIGLWAPMLLFPDGRVQSGGGFFDGHSQPNHYALGWSNPDSPRLIRRPVTWTTGAAMAVRMQDFVALDGFDASYVGGYFEDVDLCLRIRRAGMDIAFDPGVRMIHHVGTSGGSPYFMQNAQLFKERWANDPLTKPETVSVYQGWW